MSESRNQCLPPLAVTIRATDTDAYYARKTVRSLDHLVRVLCEVAKERVRKRLHVGELGAWAPNGAFLASVSVSEDAVAWQVPEVDVAANARLATVAAEVCRYERPLEDLADVLADMGEDTEPKEGGV